MDDKELWFQMDEESTVGTYKDKIKDALWRIVEDTIFRHSFKCISCWRVMLLKLFGAKIGKRCYISNRAIFVKPWNLVMGENNGIDDYAFIKCDDKITIESYVSIGNFVKIIPGGHDIRSRNFKVATGPVYIKNGVFVGADSFIGANVTIGEMAVIGSRTTINENVPDNKVIYDLPQEEYLLGNRLKKNIYKQYKYNN